jgi:hypothetical protein
LDFKTPTDYVAGNPVWSTMITYAVEPSLVDWNESGAIDEGRLVRTQDGRKQVLCDYILPGGFTAVLTGRNLLLQLKLSKLDRQTRRATTTDDQTSISFRN